MKEIREEILKINKDIEIIEDAPMSKYTSFKAGGNAKALINVTFVEDLKDIRLKFRGSSNQRIIDIQKTLQKQISHVLARR